MQVEKFISVLGYPYNDSKVVDVFADIGVNVLSDAVLADGDYNAYIEIPENGVSFVFTDEAIFLNKQKQTVGDGLLYFVGIFLYVEGKDGYSQFTGVIPKEIEFTHTQNELVTKLGVSSFERERADGSVAARRWDFPEYRIHITFSKKNDTPVVISISQPNKN